MKKLRWWEYPFAVGVLLMIVVGSGIHHSIKHGRNS